MKTETCKSCGHTYGWVLMFSKEKCAYCQGHYEDRTICKGGKGGK